ncbi:MAG: bifunctional riboflavin kinase/FMN adenylyltransferase, partial [Proteobacteria bacterium]|nr:bifunctional riboflavin kinase/FMN adenylyltransferase [Pseudomonadota bacterium]
MRVITNYKSLSEIDQGATIAIGNFDGIHLGHQSVISLARELGSGAPLGVLTFDPHPREFFNPKQVNFKLMTAKTKQNRLEKIGVELLYQLKFSKNLAALSAQDFATKVIVDGLKAVGVVVGSDFRFGNGRSGDAEILKELGKELGFKVKIAEILLGEGEQLSSTKIRKLLTNGLPRAAAKMLGHWHRIDGLVIQGDQRGRTLGYPTANLSIDGLHPPKFGVYAALVDILTGPYKGTYHGATSIGKKP